MTADTDREARLADLRREKWREYCVASAAGEAGDYGDFVDWLLSEVDRLREIEEAARDYFDAKEALDKRENMWPDGSPTASAYNKYARSRNRLKAKLEERMGEGDNTLDRDEFTRLLRLVDAAEELEHGYEPEEYDTYVERLLAHDAALRAEIDRLRARLSELEYAARSYVQSGAVNERDRLKAKLEGEADRA